MFQRSTRPAACLPEQRGPPFENGEARRVPTWVQQSPWVSFRHNPWSKSLSLKLFGHRPHRSRPIPRRWAFLDLITSKQQRHVFWNRKNQLGDLPNRARQRPKSQADFGKRYILKIWDQRWESCWRKCSLLSGARDARVRRQRKGEVWKGFGSRLQVQIPRLGKELKEIPKRYLWCLFEVWVRKKGGHQRVRKE